MARADMPVLPAPFSSSGVPVTAAKPPPRPPQRPRTFYASPDFLRDIAMRERLKNLDKDDLTHLTAKDILNTIDQ